MRRQPFNLAQAILCNLGVDPTLLLAHLRGKSASFTKKGPGRKHRQGK